MSKRNLTQPKAPVAAKKTSTKKVAAKSPVARKTPPAKLVTEQATPTVQQLTVEVPGSRIVAFVKGTTQVAGEKSAAPVAAAKLSTSTATKPTKLVWHIADEMKGATRKEVLDECAARGIAFYTARTQYQIWKSLQKASAK